MSANVRQGSKAIAAEVNIFRASKEWSWSNRGDVTKKRIYLPKNHLHSSDSSGKEGTKKCVYFVETALFTLPLAMWTQWNVYTQQNVSQAKEEVIGIRIQRNQTQL